MCSYKILNGGTTTKCSRIPWKTSLMCFYFILALMKIASTEEMPSIQKFFPSTKNDLTKVTWTHYVNTNVALQRAFNSKVMMIVGDVGGTIRSWGTKTRVALKMNSDSEGREGVTPDQIMNKVADAKSVGVKLNFDRIGIFEETMKILKAMSGKIKFPLWLNADTDNMEDKDIDKFLSLCTHNFPKATISIGMLHKGQTLGFEEGYNEKLVTQLKNTLIRNNVTQTVAFPVEFTKAVDSVDTLAALKDVQGITDSALYIYSGFVETRGNDRLPNARKLIKIFGKKRVYLDTPDYVYKKVLKNSK